MLSSCIFCMASKFPPLSPSFLLWPAVTASVFHRFMILSGHCHSLFSSVVFQLPIRYVPPYVDLYQYSGYSVWFPLCRNLRLSPRSSHRVWNQGWFLVLDNTCMFLCLGPLPSCYPTLLWSSSLAVSTYLSTACLLVIIFSVIPLAISSQMLLFLWLTSANLCSCSWYKEIISLTLSSV